MVDQRQRSLILLARIQAILGGLVALVMFSFFGLKINLLASPTIMFASAVLGLASAVYFLTFHQLIGRGRPALSTLLLTLITATNFILIIATSGGLDSPYYSLWLLAIIVAGIFGTTETVVVLAITLIYFGYALVSEGLHAPFIRDHVIQLVITLLAGGLAEWIHNRSRKATVSTTKLETLSGQLSEEQLKAQALMASIAEGVLVIDVNQKIQLFNKAAQELTGWDESSAKGIDYKLVLQLRTADDKEVSDGTDPFIMITAKLKPVVSNDLTITTRAGHKVQISLSISPILDDAGTFTGAIALFRDISREKAIERQKDEFVSTASHEMRTPVAAIEGYLSLAMNANVATVDDRARKYLESAHATIGHLGELFRDLLSVTKAEEGLLKAKIEPVNVNELLRTAIADMQFTVQKKNLTLVLQTASTVGKAIAPIYFVAANPERLREVVMNLIDNATKYTAEGGIKVTLSGDDKEVKVTISDTGGGIAAEDIPHLFPKFYRVDNSATRTVGGTGLGLYLCRQIIELFNGRIWVESKVGQGSDFIFSLPRLTEDEVKRLQTAVDHTGVTGAPGELIQPGETPQEAPKPIEMPLPAQLPNQMETSKLPLQTPTPTVLSPAAPPAQPTAPATQPVAPPPTTLTPAPPPTSPAPPPTPVPPANNPPVTPSK